MTDDLVDLIDDEESLLSGSRVPAIVEDGTAGDDILVGTDDDDTLDGKAGNDTITGLPGDDFLIGGAGEDQIDGNKGDDRIEGNQDDDILDGGNGNDRINGGQGDDTIVGGAGADELDGGDGDDQLDGKGGNDVLNGRDGADTLIGRGGNDELRGLADDDVLDGGAGRDELFGGLGDDTLSGGSSRDLLEGGDGDDRLDGGLGVDRLIGDAGNDTFAFTTDPAQVDPDRILDFAANWDDLDLSSLLPGFVAGDDLDDVVRFAVVGADTTVSIDVDGAGFVDLVRLEGVITPGLTAADLGLDSNIPVAPTVISPTGAAVVSFVPDLSATGTYATYSTDGGNGDGDFDIYSRNLETGVDTLVTVGDTGDLSAVSADGESVLFRGFAGAGGVSLADLSGGAPDITPIDAAGDRPSIADDGARYAYQSGADVVVGGDISVTFGGSDPDISPDGGWVGFVDGGNVMVRSLANGDQVDLGAGSAPAVAANGDYVAFANGGTIMWADLTGAAPALSAIDVGAAEAFTPSISNDGRFVAFRTDDDGDGDGDSIYVYDVIEDASVSFALNEDGDSPLTGAFDWLVAPSLAGNGSVIAYVDNAVWDDSVGLVDGDVVVASVDFGVGAGAGAVASLIVDGDGVA